MRYRTRAFVSPESLGRARGAGASHILRRVTNVRSGRPMTPGAPNGGQKSGKDAERTVPRKVPTGKARTDFRERASGSYGGLPPRRSMPARRRRPPGRRATPTRSAAGARGAAASNPAWRLWVIPNGPKIRAPQLAALNAPTEPPRSPRVSRECAPGPCAPGWL